ncbi:hypothetical protein BJY01DRAFT_254268 [Aspergillus pseudoustus]|uniref:Uncharacterized protein n=1 Tax=Aspergillus pseudoustus TaxID=1810923 RepID=A0ABR4IUC6_9EURO
MHAGDCSWGHEACFCTGDPQPIEEPADDNGDSDHVEPRDPKRRYFDEYEALIEEYMAAPGALPTTEGSHGLGRTDYLYRYRLLNTYTARTVENRLQASEELWDTLGPATRFGDAFLIDDIYQMTHARSGDTIETYAYVSDLKANPQTASHAVDALSETKNEVCEDVADDDGVAVKRHFPIPKGLGKTGADYRLKDVGFLWTRHINVLDASSNQDGSQATMQTILTGILNDELTLHYARWEHSRDAGSTRGPLGWAGPLLERRGGFAVRLAPYTLMQRSIRSTRTTAGWYFISISSM